MDIFSNPPQPIFLNVGGALFSCHRSTLVGDNYFNVLSQRKETELFIDRDPKHFSTILNHLRGQAILPDKRTDLLELRVEADFYCLSSLVNDIDVKLRNNVPNVCEALNQINETLKVLVRVNRDFS